MDDEGPRARRGAAVRDLLELRVPVAQAVAALGRFEWDCDEELHILTRVDALRVLGGFQRHELTVGDCRLWAETLEGRDDVGFEPGAEDMLKEFLFQIATPELAGPLTHEAASRWERALGS